MRKGPSRRSLTTNRTHASKTAQSLVSYAATAAAGALAPRRRAGVAWRGCGCGRRGGGACRLPQLRYFVEPAGVVGVAFEALAAIPGARGQGDCGVRQARAHVIGLAGWLHACMHQRRRHRHANLPRCIAAGLQRAAAAAASARGPKSTPRPRPRRSYSQVLRVLRSHAPRGVAAKEACGNDAEPHGARALVNRRVRPRRARDGGGVAARRHV